MADRIAELEHELTLLRSRLELMILPLLKEPTGSKSRRRRQAPGQGAGSAPSP
jgi:hypothetical protein